MRDVRREPRRQFGGLIMSLFTICKCSGVLRDDVVARLARIETLLTQIFLGVLQQMALLTTLTASVKQNTDVEKSAVLLLTGLTNQLKAAGTDPAALTALADSLDENTKELAAAVAANTPAAPAPPSPLAAPPVAGAAPTA